MDESKVKAFTQYFEALTGYRPLRWQTRLFERMLTGAIPSACDMPTGLGKTSVIPIWLISLTLRGEKSCVGLPRRLVYIVNRRTVVDQATEIVQKMRARLQNPEDDQWSEHKETLGELSSRLQMLCAIGGHDDVLAVSTLRGEMADNEEWKADPARPAIVVGTIDMVGSKLLFSGYGDGRYHRAHHAGLIGQDVLIVHDEAHLTPAFSDLLQGVVTFQRGGLEPRPARVMELSATQRNSCNRDVGHDVFRLVESEDRQDSIVVDRLDARKYMRLHEAAKTELVKKLVDLATQHEQPPSKVLIYAQSPETIQEIASHLKKKLKSNSDGDNERVALLTGTIRGYERDALISQFPTRLFLQGAIPQRTVYLVSTSAGEVGIDLDADHMVCDVTTLDSMIQRLGRVNRRGGKDRIAGIDVVSSLEESGEKKGTPLSTTIRATYGVLKKWAADSKEIEVGPGELAERVASLSEEERENAFSPKPGGPPLTDILLDGWSLTSLDDLPGRPEVAAYLHGVSGEPPETYVAWRKEVMLLSEAQVDREALSDWFHACRIKPHERLRDATERVRETLSNLLKAHRKQRGETHDFPVVLLNERGEGERFRLSEILGNYFRLSYRTIVLPIEACGLDKHGMLTASLEEPSADMDVAERTGNENQRERWIHIRAGNEERYERLVTGHTIASLPKTLRERERVCLREPLEDSDEESGSRDLVLVTSSAESALEEPETVRFRQTLAEHTARIVAHVETVADRLGLESALKSALALAAKWHDYGKSSPIWQRYACNGDGGEPVAKSERYLQARALGGYRHEFGSLLRAQGCRELSDHPERDLLLHLIAAHHGWARPHFESRSFDNESFTTTENEESSAEVMRRFGRLQQRFGRWGLAWLESLLRCADIAASQPAADQDTVTKNEPVISS